MTFINNMVILVMSYYQFMELLYHFFQFKLLIYGKKKNRIFQHLF